MKSPAKLLDRRLLLLGGTGFVGSRLLSALANQMENGHIVVLSRKSSPQLESFLNNAQHHEKKVKVHFEPCDLNAQEAGFKFAEMLGRYQITDCVHLLGSFFPDSSYKNYVKPRTTASNSGSSGLSSIISSTGAVLQSFVESRFQQTSTERLNRLRRHNLEPLRVVLDGITKWHAKDGDANQLRSFTYLSAEYSPRLQLIFGGEYWQSKYEAEQLLMKSEYETMINHRIILRPGMIREFRSVPNPGDCLVQGLPGIELDDLCQYILSELSAVNTPPNAKGSPVIRRTNMNSPKSNR